MYRKFAPMLILLYGIIELFAESRDYNDETLHEVDLQKGKLCHFHFPIPRNKNRL